MNIPDIKREYTSPTNSVGEFVKWWNIQFPLDKWYRVKYNIVWGSKRHKKTSLFTIYYEYEEEKVFRELDKEKTIDYSPGDWFNSEGEDIDTSQEMFDKIDLDQISEDGNINLKQ